MQKWWKGRHPDLLYKPRPREIGLGETDLERRCKTSSFFSVFFLKKKEILSRVVRLSTYYEHSTKIKKSLVHSMKAKGKNAVQISLN